MDKQSEMNNLSLIIPVFREKNNLEKLVLGIVNNITFKNYEIILVDDDSNDGSYELCLTLRKNIKNLNFIIRTKKPRDLSKACVLGFKKAKYENILVMDGDLQHDPIFIEKLFKTFIKSSSDFTVGSRNLFKKKNQNLGFVRLNTSRVLILFLNLLLGEKTSDPMSGFFIFKKKIFLECEKKLYGKGYKILVDLIYSYKKEVKITDEEIEFNTRTSGKSKMNLKILFYLLILILKKFIHRL